MNDDYGMPPSPGEFVAPTSQPVAVPAARSIAVAPTPVPAPEPEAASFQAIQQDLLAAQRQYVAQARARAAFGAEQPPPAQQGESSLGLTLVALAAGAVLGGVFAGGATGVAGGALLGAAAANGFRAVRGVTKGDEASDKEAAVDGAFALAGAAAGVYMLYKANQGESSFLSNKVEEPEDEEDEEDDAEPDDGEAKVDRPKLGPAPGVKITKLEDE